MTKPKTHRERAQRAYDYVRGTEVLVNPVSTVARLTYPTELVKAAKVFLEATHTPTSYAAALDDLRAALVLYDQHPGEPGKEG